MKETVLDVLMYLFENYQEGELVDADNQDSLSEELVAAGFPDEEVRQAFNWLDGLAEQRQLPLIFGPGRATRIYTREEVAKISTECRGFLIYLEQLGIVTAEMRELILDRLMALPEDVDLERVKWVCLLVLMNEPNAEEAFGHLEEMVYYHGEFKH